MLVRPYSSVRSQCLLTGYCPTSNSCSRIKNFHKSGPLLDISIDGCRIWILADKRKQKIVKEVPALKIDGCMHPLPNIEGCSSTRRICPNKGTVYRICFVCVQSEKYAFLVTLRPACLVRPLKYMRRGEAKLHK